MAADVCHWNVTVFGGGLSYYLSMPVTACRRIIGSKYQSKLHSVIPKLNAKFGLNEETNHTVSRG
jgi:hypothetical protein